MPTAQTSYLVSLEKAKADHKIKLWHTRLAFLKKGHGCMQKKLYSEAAVAYEKYLKILELVFGCGSGQLTPEMFKDSAKTAELSVVTGVYWDLFRIYDTSSLYGDRQKKCAVQLAKFAALTPILPDLIKKAIAFQKQAKNPDMVKVFLSSANHERPRCFIATAAFEDPLAPEVQLLRIYRDTKLKQSALGRIFIFYYYKHSPSVACVLDKHPKLKSPTKYFLKLLIKCVS